MLQVVLLKIQRLFLCVASAVLFVGFLAPANLFLPPILTGWLAGTIAGSPNEARTAAL